MAIITISAIESAEQLISGIPHVVSMDTNVPATVFYTLDGSTPTLLSSVYLESIVMPTLSPVRLRAMAVSGNDIGYFDFTYRTDGGLTPYLRRIDAYGIGIAVDAYGVESVLYDGYISDDSGNVDVPARYSDYELVDLDIKYSRTGVGGEGPGTMPIMGPIIGGQPEVDPDASSPNNENVYFNPRSLYIVLDGRDGYRDESVYPINRPWEGSIDYVKYLQGKTLYEQDPYISGGHVRTFYNYATGTAVAYYFDQNECRWVKSIQSFDPSAVPHGIGDRRQVGPPLVFKWIFNKRSMI
jgi:hypothetical protein